VILVLLIQVLVEGTGQSGTTPTFEGDSSPVWWILR